MRIDLALDLDPAIIYRAIKIKTTAKRSQAIDSSCSRFVCHQAVTMWADFDISSSMDDYSDSSGQNQEKSTKVECKPFNF